MHALARTKRRLSTLPESSRRNSAKSSTLSRYGPARSNVSCTAYNDLEQITDAVLISNIAVAGKTVEYGLFYQAPVVIQPVTRFRPAAIGCSR